MNSKQFNDDILRLTKSEIGYEMILNQPDHGEIDIKGVIVYARQVGTFTTYVSVTSLYEGIWVKSMALYI